MNVGICPVEGCKSKRVNGGHCLFHYNKKKNGKPLLDDRNPRSKTSPIGTRRDIRDGYVQIKVSKNRWMLEHRHVIEIKIGRDLLSEEEVHHINGDKSDNRLDNLELWSSSQPSGQRVIDKLSWAREIVERYGDLLDRGLLLN